MKITIKHRWKDTVLFEGEFESTKHALIKALKSRADLRGAGKKRTSVSLLTALKAVGVQFIEKE